MKNKSKNIFEAIICLAIIIITVIMTVTVTISKTTPTETRQITAMGNSSVKATSIPDNDNPENWIIVDAADDYSAVKVVKEDGNLYWVTVYEAFDDIIVIKGPDTNFHEFYFYK